MSAARPTLADLIEERRQAERRRSSPLARANRQNGDRFARWHVPEVVDHEPDNWLVTYLDLLTLLLAMLVVMLGVTRVYGWHAADDKPVALVGSVAKSGLPAYQGDYARLEDLPTIPAAWAHLPDPAAAAPLAMKTIGASAPTAVDAQHTVPAPAPPPTLDELGLGDLGDSIQVLVNSQSVSFRISTELLFPSGQAALSPTGLGLIKKLAEVINRSGHPLSIEGHSDNVPIQTRQFPSNWELSTSRATSVLRELVRDGVDGSRLRAVGYADTQPLMPNDTAQGRAANRRVELIMRITPKPADEAPRTPAAKAGAGAAHSRAAPLAAAPAASQTTAIGGAAPAGTASTNSAAAASASTIPTGASSPSGDPASSTSTSAPAAPQASRTVEQR
ncbi:OmpA/MotB family protein [Bordetella genomosp. 13]|uniref:OmpA-like domain-containing protein n=1 Tax=Bordetella genomosp. 13 TaxID=463040 RepID=A0A1W6ZB41_9BORD|nr:OmpA family protein [Bordetella genomosp. 13]ARP94465.1 hypothetical protein CAL15_08740 [Bordetella genomosp. 13]